MNSLLWIMAPGDQPVDLSGVAKPVWTYPHRRGAEHGRADWSPSSAVAFSSAVKVSPSFIVPLLF